MRRWTRWIQGGEGSRLHGSAAQVGPRIGRGRGRGETRRAHVWHTHRNPRPDGRSSAEAVPWTTYLWWGRHVGSSSFLFFTVLRPPLFLLLVDSSCPRRFLRILRYDPVRFLHRNLSRSLTRSFLLWKSDTPTCASSSGFSPFFSILLNTRENSCRGLARICKKIEYWQILSLTQKKFLS